MAGLILSLQGEFIEVQQTKTIMDIRDVANIAKELGMNPTLKELEEVLKLYEGEQEDDPSAEWYLVIEKILYDLTSDSTKEKVAIKKVVEYLYSDEANHYEEENEVENADEIHSSLLDKEHIFHPVQFLKETVG